MFFMPAESKAEPGTLWHLKFKNSIVRILRVHIGVDPEILHNLFTFLRLYDIWRGNHYDCSGEKCPSSHFSNIKNLFG